MTTQTPAPYQPTSDDDARLHLAQILGSDLSIDGIWTGNWHDSLRTYAADCQPQDPATAEQPTAAAA